MHLPSIQGVIDRRILVNYRVDAEVAARLLPAPFRPKLIGGFAVAGICLIRLKYMRPAFLPAVAGVGSENAAHRFAVEWEQHGQRYEGVFIPRRDSSSRLNSLLGSRLVPGEHHHARFNVAESNERVHVDFRSDDGHTHASITARLVDDLPASSMFRSLQEASQFFQNGALGYSATRDEGRYEGLELRCRAWAIQPLTVEDLRSSYFDDTTKFPKGSVTFDSALLMRGVHHEWHARDDLWEPVSEERACTRDSMFHPRIDTLTTR
jgi:hypothetical protein